MILELTLDEAKDVGAALKFAADTDKEHKRGYQTLYERVVKAALDQIKRDTREEVTRAFDEASRN